MGAREPASFWRENVKAVVIRRKQVTVTSYQMLDPEVPVIYKETYSEAFRGVYLLISSS